MKLNIVAQFPWKGTTERAFIRVDLCFAHSRHDAAGGQAAVRTFDTSRIIAPACQPWLFFREALICCAGWRYLEFVYPRRTHSLGRASDLCLRLPVAAANICSVVRHAGQGLPQNALSVS